MSETKPFPITEDLLYVEDIDRELFIPAMDVIEDGIKKLGFKVSDDLSDAIFEVIEKLVYVDLFPATDYRNYN